MDMEIDMDRKIWIELGKSNTDGGWVMCKRYRIRRIYSSGVGNTDRERGIWTKWCKWRGTGVVHMNVGGYGIFLKWRGGVANPQFLYTTKLYHIKRKLEITFYLFLQIPLESHH